MKGVEVMELSKLKTSLIDDKYWEVLEDYVYETSIGTVVVPNGFKTDYASVPKIFRNIINTYGKHGKAAVVHDWLYSKNCNIDITRAEADKIFLEILKEGGVNPILARLMYIAVRCFGKTRYKIKK